MVQNDAAQLLVDAFSALGRMHEEAVTVRNGLRTGITDYAYHAKYRKKTYEVPIYKRMSELLRNRDWSGACDQCYPGSARACDVVVHRGEEFTCWLETKLVWREWLSTVSSSVKYWTDDSYVLGPGEGRRRRHHSLAQDFAKLEAIGPDRASDLAVLALAFDARNNQLDQVIACMEREQRLHERGWSRVTPQILEDWNSADHRIVLWGWHKRVRS